MTSRTKRSHAWHEPSLDYDQMIKPKTLFSSLQFIKSNHSQWNISHQSWWHSSLLLRSIISSEPPPRHLQSDLRILSRSKFGVLIMLKLPNCRSFSRYTFVIRTFLTSRRSLSLSSIYELALCIQFDTILATIYMIFLDAMLKWASRLLVRLSGLSSCSAHGRRPECHVTLVAC